MELNWLADDVVTQKDIHYRFYGGIHWLHALSLLAPNDDDIFAAYRQKKIIPLKKSKYFTNTLAAVCKDLTMSLSYYHSLRALDELTDKKNILRIAIIAWYYGIYFSAKAMIGATKTLYLNNNHLKTAHYWLELIVKNNLSIAPFDLFLPSLVKEDIDSYIAHHPLYQAYDNNRPQTTTQAFNLLLVNLKNAGYYYRKSAETIIKYDKKISDFRTQKNRLIRDEILIQKSAGFLHQAYRIKRKANYQDMDYLTFFDDTLLIDEFILDLQHVLQSFCYMALYYCFNKLNADEFNKFLHNIAIVFPLFPKIKNTLD